MGRRRKKSRKSRGGSSADGSAVAAAGSEEPESLTKAPHSFVIKRGRIGKSVNELMVNFRQVMEPFTAASLRVKRYNVVKDFVHIASTLNVTHLAVFTKTTKSSYMRLCRLPRGPTLTFKIVNYTLTKDVRTSLKRPLVYSGLFQLSPLLILNGFGGSGGGDGPDGQELQMKLMTSMWRNMFPALDVNKVNLNTIRRCILLNYDRDTRLIEFRHYAIKLKPVGLSRTVRKLVAGKKVPDLGQFNDMTDVVGSAGDNNAFTESEGEADEVEQNRHIMLTQRISSRGNMVNEKSAIRLTELGPRLTLELMKIEEGIMAGEVLFHSLIQRTKAEIKELKHRRQQLQDLKLSRKRQQELNVKRKLMAKNKDNKSINESNDNEEDGDGNDDEDIDEDIDEDMDVLE
ncbi:protein Peter pan-like [Oppia nitens]|uniref:protein Peter pan-like n=1 Tax=Oppia nitens TaxID=1686743 RepID=UPI0023D9D93C|nr:protein Peter pan-like [Oppia nitens]